MAATTVGVLRETTPGERRVALVPALVPDLGRLGFTVLLERGAGARAGHHDEAYAAAGAEPVGHPELLRRADVLLGVQAPGADPAQDLRPGQLLVALLRPTRNPYLVRRWADGGISTIGLDLAPPGPPEAYAMDAVASQARITGYQAVLFAAVRLGRCLPPWGTPDALFAPVRVLVAGAGHAGLQAIDTARRLGAQVHVVEPRRAERAEALALGAEPLDLPGLHPVADDVALRELLDHELTALRDGLAAAVVRHDLVLTDIEPPGREPPCVLDTAAVARMPSGSVLVDFTADTGVGNIEGAEPGRTTLVGDGTTVIGAGDLAVQVPVTASLAYAHNAVALLAHLTRGGELVLDPADPVQAAMLVTHQGSVRHGATWQLLLDATAVAGLP